MSRISAEIVDGIINAFDERFRYQKYRCSRTGAVRTRVINALARYKTRHLKDAVMTAFIKKAVGCFADGEIRRGRRYYDAAFAYARGSTPHKKNSVRAVLLRECIDAALELQSAGRHQSIWRLANVACAYPPHDLEGDGVVLMFEKYGVRFSDLEQPMAERFWRMPTSRIVPSFALATA